MIVSVILDIKNSQLNKTFDYLVPLKFQSIIKCGVRVFAPFGRRNLLGIVKEIKETSELQIKLKEIISVLDFEPVLTEEMLVLGENLSKQYFSFLIENYFMMIPNALKGKYVKIVDFTNYDNSINSINLIKKDRIKVPFTEFSDYLKEIKQLKDNHLIEITNDFEEKNSKKFEKVVHLVTEEKATTSKQLSIISYLKEVGGSQNLNLLTNDMGYSKAVINTLVKNGALRVEQKEVYRDVSVLKTSDKSIVLNDEQEAVYDEIKNSIGFNEFLVKGICGSGKTEIYLNLIEEVIKNGKQAIMLVPEISLTPQMASRFKARFNSLVAIMHSQMSNGERYDEWRRIKNGDAKIVVGARSALFVPMTNIGIIIMDEEQSDSYIQDSNPRYDAHFVAKERAKYHNCPLVYGSATPRVLTNYKACENEIKLLKLTKRANNKPMPVSFIVDMRKELKEGNRSVISRPLKEALIDTYNKNQQSVLLINRRGYSTFVMCRSCGEEIKCPHCDITLTYHRTREKLVCHYCGYQQATPTVCPSCGSNYIKFLGDGTQKLEEEINLLLPEAKVIRMDSDSTTKKNSHDEIIDKFQKHEADILLGTQVVAKGLDFPLVSLVGIVNADLGLKIPFYDAYEKTYDLIEQASGRAGRKETDGKVIIQTYNPDHIVIRAASSHNYDMFYEEELKYRKIANNPPFKQLIEIVVSACEKNKAYQEICNIKNLITEEIPNALIVGPVQNYIFKIKDRYLFQIVLRLDNEDTSILTTINEHFQNKKDVYLSIKRM